MSSELDTSGLLALLALLFSGSAEAPETPAG